MDIAKHLRDITKDNAIYSYNELKEMTVSGPDFSRVGLKALQKCTRLSKICCQK